MRRSAFILQIPLLVLVEGAPAGTVGIHPEDEAVQFVAGELHAAVARFDPLEERTPQRAEPKRLRERLVVVVGRVP